MDLIRQLNETTTQHDAEDAIYEYNCTRVAEQAGVEVQELTETIIDWLNDVAQQAEAGTLLKPSSDNTAAAADHAEKMKGTSEIMGAVDALTENPEALNISTQKAKTILKIAHSDNKLSDKVKDYLKGLGRDEARHQAQRAADAFRSGDQQAIVAKVTEMRNKAKKLLLFVSPEEAAANRTSQGEQKPGRLGLAGAMEQKPQI